MKKNVLLVDDDNIFNYLNQHILQNMGIVNEVHTALNGREALELFNNYFSGAIAIPDIIFLDLNMPIMDGFAFLEAFKKLNIPNKEKISIIIVSSSEDPSDIKRARNFGVDHYLTKPITASDLKMALG
jgi:CheY-like chemotaxis protein